MKKRWVAGLAKQSALVAAVSALGASWGAGISMGLQNAEAFGWGDALLGARMSLSGYDFSEVGIGMAIGAVAGAVAIPGILWVADKASESIRERKRSIRPWR